jgi:acyl dehydratase
MILRLRCSCGRSLADAYLEPTTGHLVVAPRAQVALARWPPPVNPGTAMTFRVQCTSRSEIRRRLGRVAKRQDGPRSCGADWQFRSSRLEATWERLYDPRRRVAYAVLGHDL